MKHGRKYKIDRGSFEGQYRYQLDYLTLHIQYPGVRPLTPYIPTSFGIPNPVSDEYVNDYLPYLMCDVKNETEQYTYGQYLEEQIAKVINMYKKDGYNTNQAYMTVGDPKTLDMVDPPCLRGIDTRIIDSVLHFFVYFRSWDLWSGLPANLAGIQILKEYMASEIGVKDGAIVAATKGGHIYHYALEYTQKYTGKNFRD
jgi:thymidylate synthase